MRLLVCLVLFNCCFYGFAQRKHDRIINGASPTTIINIPPDSVWRKWLPAKDTAWYIEINSTETLAKYLSDYYNQWEDMPAVDFSKFSITGAYTCGQCAQYCTEFGCHRNACRYSFGWYIAPQKPWYNLPARFSAFYTRAQRDTSSVPVISDDYGNDKTHTTGQSTSPDIIIQRGEGGDCHARFSHILVRNDETKTIVWTVYNHYGGCRAGLFKDFAYKIENPGPGYTIVFERVRID